MRRLMVRTPVVVLVFPPPALVSPRSTAASPTNPNRFSGYSAAEQSLRFDARHQLGKHSLGEGILAEAWRLQARIENLFDKDHETAAFFNQPGRRRNKTMLTLPPLNQLVIGLVLALLIIATRSHHCATFNQLPGASWAVFLLAGYLSAPGVGPGGLPGTDLGDIKRAFRAGVRAQTGVDL